METTHNMNYEDPANPKISSPNRLPSRTVYIYIYIPYTCIYMDNSTACILEFKRPQKQERDASPNNRPDRRQPGRAVLVEALR